MARIKILTPYQATWIMNQHRAQLGLKPVQSPFMYIQARKGKYDIEIAPDGRKQIVDTEKFLRWVYEHNMRQAARNMAQQGHADLERLAIEAPVK